jgi:hypothetical protein
MMQWKKTRKITGKGGEKTRKFTGKGGKIYPGNFPVR